MAVVDGFVRARAGEHGTRLAKSCGERLRGCNVRNMNPEKAEGLSPELQAVLEPLLACIESQGAKQIAAPPARRTRNLHRAK